MAQQLSNQRIAWFNGKFMPENEVMIPFRDRSWKYGDGKTPGPITKKLIDAYSKDVGCDFVAQYLKFLQ